MLRLEKITVRVGEKKLLDAVSVDFEARKMNLIIGPNGSGKSTLIKATSKQLPISNGRISYGEQEITTLDYRQLSTFRAVLSQNTEIAFPLKVWEVVMMGRSPHFMSSPGAVDRHAVEEAMNYFDVASMADREYLTLSGGEKQRVNFARVLAQIWFPQPNQMRYLLLDEPLTFLDVNYQYQFMHKLQKLAEKKDMVIVGVVHDLNLAARFADTITLLSEGRILAKGNPNEVLTKENIQAAFHIKPEIFRHNELVFISF